MEGPPAHPAAPSPGADLGALNAWRGPCTKPPLSPGQQLGLAQRSTNTPPFASSSCSVAFRCHLPCNVTETDLPVCSADKPISHADGHTLFGSVFLILNARTSSLGFAPLLWLLYTVVNPSLTSGVSVTFTHVTVTFFSRPKLHVAGSVSRPHLFSVTVLQPLRVSAFLFPPLKCPQLNVCGPFRKCIRLGEIYPSLQSPDSSLQN